VCPRPRAAGDQQSDKGRERRAGRGEASGPVGWRRRRGRDGLLWPADGGSNAAAWAEKIELKGLKGGTEFAAIASKLSSKL